MIIVSSLSKAPTLVVEHRASHVVSLLGPGTPHPTYEVPSHLKLTFHDIVQPTEGYVPPVLADAERLVAFLTLWRREQPLLIHCWAGISRSTAAAYTALCLARPQASEEDLAWELREASPSATPNRLLISYTDHLLNRDGRMVKAIDAIGRGAEAYEGTPFILRP